MNGVGKSTQLTLGSDEKQLAQRFTDRLDSLLDLRGAPKALQDRTRFLISNVGVDETTALQFLAGAVAPTLVQLSHISLALDTEPGYFINASQQPQFRSLRKLRGLNGGETIHVELPRGFDRTTGCANDLGWVNGIIIAPGVISLTDIVVVQRSAPALIDSQHYVIETSRGFNGYLCKVLPNSKVMLSGPQKPEGILLSVSPQGIPVSADLRRLDIASISRIVYIIRNMVTDLRKGLVHEDKALLIR